MNAVTGATLGNPKRVGYTHSVYLLYSPLLFCFLVLSEILLLTTTTKKIEMRWLRQIVECRAEPFAPTPQCCVPVCCPMLVFGVSCFCVQDVIK